MAHLVAHRGASAQARENTHAAFEKAIELGADMIELDIKRTRDGIIVINHDPVINGKRIADLTYAQLLRLPGCTHIPRFDEVLAALAGRIRLDIDLRERGYEAELIDLVHQYFPYADFVLTSSDEAILRASKIHAPQVRTGLIIGHPNSNPFKLSRGELFPLRRLKAAKADFITCSYLLVKMGLPVQAKAAGVPLYVWTINNHRSYRWIKRLPTVEAILSDLPETFDVTAAKSQQKLVRGTLHLR